MKPDALTRWTPEDSAELYGVRNWGAGYFDVADSGEVIVRPRGRGGEVSISLMEIVSGLKARGLGMPVLLRFGDILASRVAQLNASFAKAMADAGYTAEYRGVYPIKVNQQQQVVEAVVAFGRPFHHGLEAGSKAELIAALAYISDPEAFIVCNGYKDEEFVELALHALKMGLQTVIVLEMADELPMVMERAKAIGVRPRLGVRVKLATRGGGHWTDSGGDRSTFGLNASQIIDVVDWLRAENALDCLHMLHYHIGSQIPNIRSVRAAASEACRFYVDLVKEGAKMGVLNVGGGLAVDYDGSHTNFQSSSNYAVDEYAADIVEVVMKVCNVAQVPHPVLVSESGRATVAHHSVLLFNMLESTRFESHGLPDGLPPDAPEPLRQLMDVSASLTSKNVQECYHDAVYYRDETRALHEVGSVSLRYRALAERIFWSIVTRIAAEIQGRKYVPDELSGLEVAIADVYYGNFSVFQSLPDVWAIDQLFPVMPVHRLKEAPTRQATISDITCDCDGKIDRFIDLHDVRQTLPVHELNDSGEYYVGVFLVGAYQETLGDLHNLLGDTNVVNLRIGEGGTVEYAHEIAGDTVADVLSYVEYNPQEMLDRMRKNAEQAVRAGRITVEERRQLMQAYEAGLRGYTYFEK
ncbi:MAG TPA: biosynthetic arginine decarboxylase [Kiritimatiellia bacterium]|nr:biosynthetic arginine decarboxylase [Kiritimatiellia bacterium]HRZ13759.1 biosynthetic arginine decarboxylase [Kiritimatiellia bacterium]HSA19698.1 biosynthetic arginine decarboxylase [Kiritimatiellia bacterium]